MGKKDFKFYLEKLLIKALPLFLHDSFKGEREAQAQRTLV